MDRPNSTYQEDSTSEPIKKESKSAFEVTHVNIRTSIVFVILKLLVLDILASATALVFFGVISSGYLSNQISFFLISNSAFYFLILAAVKIVFTLYVVIQWLNEYYEITPQRIVYRRGIFWRKVDVYDYAHVRSLGIQQGVLGRIFNFGSLSIYDRGVYKYYYLSYIHNPQRYFKLLQNLCPDADMEKDVVREQVHDEENKP